MSAEESIVHDVWIRALNDINETSTNSDIRWLARFTAEILEHCGSTPDLTAFLNHRALQALEKND